MVVRGSRFVALAATAGNILIMIAKVAAAWHTGSSAMVSEAIHSGVDVFDGLLIFIGLNRSVRSADELHPFGYGKELFFWSFIAAMMIFATGCGLSLYEGCMRLLHPRPVARFGWSYASLAIAFLLDGSTLLIARRELRRGESAGRRFWETIHDAKDPSIIGLMLEDTAALIGIGGAALGLALSQWLGMPVFDGLASLAIGLLLGGVAIVLGNESRSLLMGEAFEPAKLAELKRLVAADPAVEGIGEPLTMYVGPNTVLLNLAVRFRHSGSVAELEEAIVRLERHIAQAFPEITRIYIEADSLRSALAPTAVATP